MVERTISRGKRDQTGMMRLKIYRFILAFKRAHDGISPTSREIARDLRVSRSTVSYHIEKLKELHLITLFGEGKIMRNIMIPGGYNNISEEKRSEYERIIEESENRFIDHGKHSE